MEMRRSKPDISLGLIAKRLRDDSEHVTHEPLPQRWEELIHYLDEQERKRDKRRLAETEQREARD